MLPKGRPIVQYARLLTAFAALGIIIRWLLALATSRHDVNINYRLQQED